MTLGWTFLKEAMAACKNVWVRVDPAPFSIAGGSFGAAAVVAPAPGHAGDEPKRQERDHDPREARAESHISASSS